MVQTKHTVTLRVHDETPRVDPTPEEVRNALDRMKAKGGPWFLILDGCGEDCAQAAGGEGMFMVEWREYNGKAFQLWTAGRRDEPDEGEVTIPAFDREVKLRSNECLVPVQAEAILLAYLAGMAKPQQFMWRDITDMFRDVPKG